MHILLVHVHVKNEFIASFIEATLANARNSIQEPGVLRFDFYQQAEDPGRFTLVEVYRQTEDHAKHRDSAHYLTWRDAVGEMMAEPRLGVKYQNLFPADEDWSE